MTEAEFKAFVGRHPFRFAKSMSDIPHAYIVRKNVNDEENWKKAVMFIRENGYDKKFYSKTFRYYDLDGYCYWTMGDPLDVTIILNRAKL